MSVDEADQDLESPCVCQVNEHLSTGETLPVLSELSLA